MSGFPSPGTYTVQGTVAGNDLVASLYAQGGDIYIGNVSILCTIIVQAFAVIGYPIVAASAIDSTRSGNIDSSQYTPPVRVPRGQCYSILWPGAGVPVTNLDGSNGSPVASMSVTVVTGSP